MVTAIITTLIVVVAVPAALMIIGLAADSMGLF